MKGGYQIDLVYGLSNSTMADPTWKGQESGSCSILESFWSSVYIGILKKQVLIPMKGCLNSRLNELASQRGCQAGKKQKLLTSSFMRAATRRPRFRVGLPTLSDSIKKISHRVPRLQFISFPPVCQFLAQFCYYWSPIPKESLHMPTSWNVFSGPCIKIFGPL